MRVSCLQENLAKGLSIVGRAVSTRSTLPVLGNILLEARNNQLRLAATNFEISVSCWIGAKVEEEGAITVPARLLTDFVNSLPAERIDMALTVRTQTLELQCARFSATMRGIDAAEFPIIATMSSDSEADDTPKVEGTAIALETAGLRKMIDQVIFAASSDESRPTLTGVEVRFQEDRLSMAATDGYRLSVRSVPLDVPATNDDMTVIIPAKSLGELARISNDADEEQPVHVLVTEERNQILFQVFGKDDAKGNYHRVELVSQLIDARYPDYRAIIPDHYDTRTVIATEQFLKAVRVAILFARDNANIIKLSLAPGNGSNEGQLRLSASSNEMGDSVNDIDADVQGNELEIAFNARYLIDVLSQIDQPQVILETTLPTRPGAIRPVGMGTEEFLHVVMPMHQPR